MQARLMMGLLALLVWSTQIVAVHGASATHPHRHPEKSTPNGPPRETLLYAVGVDRDTCTRTGTCSPDPDFVLVIGADPKNRKTFGKVITRVDLPTAGNELHHFHMSADGQRLIIPGFASNRLHIVDISVPTQPKLRHVRSLDPSGYVGPHSVLPQKDGTSLITMLGSRATLGPAGIIVVDDRSGKFVKHFGPGPDRAPTDAPMNMYDFAPRRDLNRGISTTWGWFSTVYPAPLGVSNRTINVWDLRKQEVIQEIPVETDSFETHWVGKTTYGFTHGGEYIWLWSDTDRNGFYDVETLRPTPCTNRETGESTGPDSSLTDITLSLDHRFLFVSDYFPAESNEGTAAGRVRVYNIENLRKPKCVDEKPVPHSGMMRLSADGRRLYVSNMVLSTYEDAFQLNDDYGIWLFDVDPKRGRLVSMTRGARPWLDLMSLRKATRRGAAGAHMMLFDARVPRDPGDG